MEDIKLRSSYADDYETAYQLLIKSHHTEEQAKEMAHGLVALGYAAGYSIADDEEIKAMMMHKDQDIIVSDDKPTTLQDATDDELIKEYERRGWHVTTTRVAKGCCSVGKKLIMERVP